MPVPFTISRDFSAAEVGVDVKASRPKTVASASYKELD